MATGQNGWFRRRARKVVAKKRQKVPYGVGLAFHVYCPLHTHRIASDSAPLRPGKMGGSGAGREKVVAKKRQKVPHGVGLAFHVYRSARALDTAPYSVGQNGWFLRRGEKKLLLKKGKKSQHSGSCYYYAPPIYKVGTRKHTCSPSSTR